MDARAARTRRGGPVPTVALSPPRARARARAARAQVFYASADAPVDGAAAGAAGPAPVAPANSSFTVTLEDVRSGGSSSRVCHVGKSTRASDVAALVQAHDGTPSAPRLFLDGYELPGDAIVCKIARPGSVVLVVPQLTELVSFFVAKVTRPAPQLLVDGTMTVADVKVCARARATRQLAAPLCPTWRAGAALRGQRESERASARAREGGREGQREVERSLVRAPPAAAAATDGCCRRARGPRCTHALTRPRARPRRGARPLAAQSQLNEAAGVHDVHSIVNYRGRALADATSMRECGVTSATQLHVMLRDSDSLHGLPAGSGGRLLGDRMLRMVRDVRAGLDAGVQPQLINDGLGGAYYLRDDADRNVGVFKPVDEEPYAPANPKGYAGDLEAMGTLSLAKPGVSVGRAAQRECAAYLLDHGSWAGVPHTAFLWVLHTATGDDSASQLKVELKSGSFQRYVPHLCTAEDQGPSRFERRSAQRIAAFDVRVCNSDRHSGNLLVQGGEHRRQERTQDTQVDAESDADADESGSDDGDAQGESAAGRLLRRAAEARTRARGDAGGHRAADADAEADAGLSAERAALEEKVLSLVPIDHGFILPHYRMLGEINFEWASWPQASEPLDESMREYIAALDSHADAALLRIASSLPEESLVTLHLGTMLLQLGVGAGLTLAQIAQLAMRDGRVPSALERAVEYAEGVAENEVRWLHLLPGPVLRTGSSQASSPTTAAGSSAAGTPLERDGLAAAAAAKGAPKFPPPHVATAAAGSRSSSAPPSHPGSHSTSPAREAGAARAVGAVPARSGSRSPSPPLPGVPPASSVPHSTPPMSPIESPLHRPAGGPDASVAERRAWEDAFLSAARRHLELEIRALLGPQAQGAHGSSSAGPPDAAAAALGDDDEALGLGSAGAAAAAVSGSPPDEQMPFEMHEAMPRMVVHPSASSAEFPPYAHSLDAAAAAPERPPLGASPPLASSPTRGGLSFGYGRGSPIARRPGEHGGGGGSPPLTRYGQQLEPPLAFGPLVLPTPPRSPATSQHGGSARGGSDDGSGRHGRAPGARPSLMASSPSMFSSISSATLPPPISLEHVRVVDDPHEEELAALARAGAVGVVRSYSGASAASGSVREPELAPTPGARSAAPSARSMPSVSVPGERDDGTSPEPTSSSSSSPVSPPAPYDPEPTRVSVA